MVLYIPLVAWAGIRRMSLFLLQGVLFALMVGASFYYSRRPPADGKPPYASIILSMLAVTSLSSALSPFILVSGVAAACAMAFLIQPGRSRRTPIIALGCLTVVLPFLLEWT